MMKVAGLALPFFGLILLGYLAGRIWRRDENALVWLNIFVLYFALPALFFQLISRTPIQELANWSFVFSTSLATYSAFAIAFSFAMLKNRGNLPQATVQGMVGGYGNVGYMGPPLALVALGPDAAVPAALIFCFDIALVFTLAPMMMAIGGSGEEPLGKILIAIPRKIFLHPFIIATLAGVASAALEFRPPEPIDAMLTFLQSSAAPAALFALWVTVALRPLERVASELPVLIAIKLILHPLIAFLILTWVGGFEPIWIYTGVMMASLPPAATIYVIATQYKTYILRGSSAILLGTAFSVPSVTIVLYLISNEPLPLDLFSR